REHAVENEQARSLRRDRQIEDRRRGHALVDVGRPGVERGERHLEGEAGQEKEQSKRYGRALRESGPAEGLEPRASRRPEEKRHAVDRERRAEGSGQEILQPRLRRRLDATEESGEHVEGERQGLKPDEDDQQVEAPRHQGNAEVPPQKESVELALLLARALQVGFGDQDRQGRATSQEQADEKRQRRGLEPPTPPRPERRTRQKKERSADSEESHRREPPPQLRRKRFEQQDAAAGDGTGG